MSRGPGRQEKRKARAPGRRPFTGPAAAAIAAVLSMAWSLGPATGAAEPARPTRRLIDPVGDFVPVKPKVFKDLDHVEITDFDPVRVRNTGRPHALVHMKQRGSALEPLEFQLSDLNLRFAARDPAGVTYRFRGQFERGGDLYALGKTSEIVLRGHLAAYQGEELLRQETLRFKYRPGEE